MRSMPQFVPVSFERHAGTSWRGVSNYGFASSEAAVPLVAAEMASAAVGVPIAFVVTAGRHVPMAIMSPTPGRNLYIGPAGQWLGGYIPAAFRGHPFRLGQIEGRDDKVLCVDEASGLILDAGDNTKEAELAIDPSGASVNTGTDQDQLNLDKAGDQGGRNAFFDPDGQLSANTKAAFNFLLSLERNRVSTDAAVHALSEANVLQPWAFQVRVDGQDIAVNGLFRVDEAALNALDDQWFLYLRQMGALAIAYAQLFSMGQARNLERLAQVQQQLAPQPGAQYGLPGQFRMADSDTVKI